MPVRLLLLAAVVAGVVLAPTIPTRKDADAVAAQRTRSDVGVDVRRGIRYAAGGNTVMDVYRNRRAGPRLAPAVLVVHGGGWWGGDKRRMAGIAHFLARHGFVAFNANYTLAAPGRPGFPRQASELRAAIRFIRRHAGRLGVDPRRIGALGSSAGAHLVGLLAVATHGPLRGGSRVRAAVTWSAPFDLAQPERGPLVPAIDAFLGCGGTVCAERRAAASPVAHASADDPPMLIVNSERELVPAVHAETMASRLVDAGVPHELRILPGSGHARDYTATALAPSTAFLRQHLR